MTRLGLTGGIGSGKSTVAELLRTHGAAVIDADAISRNLTAPGGLAIKPIAECFGHAFIAADGALDRDKMRQASYADIHARKQLEAILHPLIGSELDRVEAVATQSGCRCIVFDIPLLVESSRWRQKVDQVLVVDCLAEVQIARVFARSGLARDMVEKIIASQASRAQRLRAADLIIFNSDVSKAILALEVEQIAQLLGL
jgi:dephospho-CoA kinase